MKQSVFHLANMCCSSEESTVRKRLQPMAGVRNLRFNVMERQLTVDHVLESEETLLVALEEIGMGPQPRAAQPRGHSRAFWARLALCGLLAAACEGLHYFGLDSRWVAGLALLSMALGGGETFRKGWLALRSFNPNINFLMSVAVLGALAIGQWPEAAMVTFLFTVAELIEGYSLERARQAIRTMMELSPEMATRVDKDGKERRISASRFQLGEIARVKPGERIPLDGELVAGNSSVNQAPITGESLPVEKQPGDSVFAGSVNERGSFDFRVTAVRGNTTLDRIVAAVQRAQSERAPTQRIVDQVARVYTPAMLLLSLLLALVPSLWLGAPALPWIYRALTLLVVACPCALVLSTPVTVVSGLAAGARAGILIKGGVYLESGYRLRALALDKTGTLTEGRPVVTEVVSLSALSERELLQRVASLEARSEHPVASAVLSYYGEGELLEVSDFEALVGRGLRGRLLGEGYRLGSYRLVQEAGLATPALDARVEQLEVASKTVVLLLSGEAVLGLVAVVDRIRASSVQAVQQLRQLGVEPLMLSGDNEKTAQAIAAQLGITEVHANLLPEEKLSHIEQALQRYGAVGMVGDGVNDAPALARASIGFAMGGAGTATALETADVALMQDDLRRLPDFLRLSRQTSRILRQNIAFALAVKLVAVALTFGGQLTLWMAVFADMGASLLVIANGLRMLRFLKG